MIPLLVVVVQVAACIGLGAMLLRALGTLGRLPPRERPVWSFVLGLGVLGWLIFPLGLGDWLGQGTLLALLLAGCAGLPLLGRDGLPGLAERPSGWTAVLLAALAVAVALDLIEALAPPTDADSLAYHFTLPKRFLAAGGLVFEPRAVDGAVPLLVQMTYLPALALGGERALTLWAGVSGWGLGALVYVIARRYLDRPWSLAATLLVMTAPAVVYGAGSGQVETRLAAFALAAVVAAGLALRDERLDLAALAGIAAGFYAGTKYVGLLLVAVCGVAMLMRRGWLVRGAVFGTAALMAGFQWYFWNGFNSGDPLFPILFPLLGDGGYGLWDAAHHAQLRETFFQVELPFPRNPLWLAAYPLIATMGGPPVLEAGRTGLGPWALLALPFALGAAWRFRRRLVGHPLFPVAAMVVAFFVAWYLSGSSQRVRHLLPLYPALVLVLAVAARRWAAERGVLAPLTVAATATLLLQLAGHGLFTVSPARYVFTDESRESYLHRTVRDYGVVPWVNSHLSPASTRLAVDRRQLLYFLDVPTYLMHHTHEALVDDRPGSRDAGRFLAQLRRLGVTHLLTNDLPVGVSPYTSGLGYLSQALVEAGCARSVYAVSGQRRASRTLPNPDLPVRTDRVLELVPGDCRP